MQKMMFLSGINQGDVDKVNQLLNDGWKVIDMQCGCPGDGCDMQGYVLLEKDTDKEACACKGLK